MESIADEIIESGQYTAKRYEESRADKIEAAVAYGAKIFRPLVKVLDEKVPNHKNSEPTVTDLVFADICKRIIKENGEEDDLYDHFYALYIKTSGVYGRPENAYEILLGVDSLVDVIYEWKQDLASVYKESIEKTELQNVQKGDLTEYRWSFLVLNESKTDTVTFYPRQIFGEKYPVCLMLYDAYYGIDKTTENLSLPSDWDDVEIPETDPVKLALLEIYNIAERYTDGEEQEHALLACKVQSEALVAEHGADLFKPIIELQKKIQDERGYKYLYEIDPEHYTENGDAAIAEICRKLFDQNGETDVQTLYDRSFPRTSDTEEYSETSVDGLFFMIAAARAENESAFDKSHPFCAAFYRAYCGVWYSSPACEDLKAVISELKIDKVRETMLLVRTCYMTESEINAFASKVRTSWAGGEGFPELYLKALKGLRYSKTLMIIKACGEYYVDFIDNYKTVVKAANKLSFEELCKVTESSESIRAFLDNDLHFNTYKNYLWGKFEEMCREKPGLGMRRETVVRLMNSISDEMQNDLMNELFALSDFDASVDALIEKYKVYAKSDSEFYKTEIESIRIMKRVNGVFAGYADVAVSSELAEKLLSAVYALRIGEPDGQTGWPEGTAYVVGFEGVTSVMIAGDGTLLNSDLIRFETRNESAGTLIELLSSLSYKTNGEPDVTPAETDPVKSLLMQLIKTAEGYGVGDQSSVLLECSAKIDEAVGYGADIFKPIIELQKSRQEKRGYKYLYEIDGHKYSSSILLDNGDAALAEICRRIFEHNGEAGFYVNFTVRLDRIFDIKREYTEASVDGLYGTVAMCILTYSEGAEAFDAAFPTCKAFYEAYRQVWFSSDGCVKVIDAMNTTGLDPISQYTQLNYTLYMTEAEKEAFAEKILSANGDTELVKKSFSSMYYELSYFKNLRNLIIASASDLDFSTLDLDGVDSIWFTPESPSARYKGKSFTKDGKDSQVFNELLQSTAALRLFPLSEIPERAYADVTTYRITLYRGEETVLIYRADTEANLFFIYSYINGSGSESVYTANPGNLPPLIQAIEDAQKSYAE